MKIAILTLPLHTNYGGILQAYALQKYLKQQGHSSEVILLQLYSRPTYKIWLSLLKSIILTILGKGEERRVWLELQERYHQKQIARRIDKFIKKNIKFSPSVQNIETLHKLANNKYDAFIVGSDQVWSKQYMSSLPMEYFFLDFVPMSVTKIAFAASFGSNKNDYSIEEQEKCGTSYSRLDFVSVREHSAIDFIKKELGWENKSNCEHILDPTMLFNKDFYIKQFNLKQNAAKQDTIFTYILDELVNKELFTNPLREEYQIINVPSSDTYFNKTKSNVMVSPIEWLQTIFNSCAIITDSFHCCVFSILFHRPFLVVLNSIRGNSRIESLMTTFNLNNRILSAPNDIVNKKALLKGYSLEELSVIDNILDYHQGQSFTFLKNALK